MIKIPYGISDFGELRRKGSYYVDRTSYIEALEADTSAEYILFLRPRRFGKSLWISTLQHYYGLEYKDDFQRLFGDLYIGQNPTPEANSYKVLRFSFSSIDTQSPERVEKSFWIRVRQGIQEFLGLYYPDEDRSWIYQEMSSANLLGELFSYLVNKGDRKTLYVLIDEYDHFANKLLEGGKQVFLKLVGGNGFVRTFYEALKEGTISVVGRIFITGVSPLTLDSLSSGFNISRNYSLKPLFHDMLGFREEEVIELLQQLEFTGQALVDILQRIRAWYDGYRFHKNAPYGLYNPDMVLYFASEYLPSFIIPENLLDTNIASDYGKIRALARLGDKECIKVLEKLVRHEDYPASLTLKFNLELDFTATDFVSLLYYMGLLTMKGEKVFRPNFGMPNYVIETLYYAYFLQILRERTQLPIRSLEIDEAVVDLALHNDSARFIALAENLMQNLSNRDSLNFGEKHLQSILFALLFPTNIYSVITEYEVGRRYVDVFLQRRDDSLDINQFLLELKYLPKSHASQLEKVRKAGVEQLQAYASHERFKKEPRLHAYIIVFVGAKAEVVEEVDI